MYTYDIPYCINLILNWQAWIFVIVFTIVAIIILVFAFAYNTFLIIIFLIMLTSACLYLTRSLLLSVAEVKTI